ncbi:MAG: sodium-dependent transporter [archaeon]|nr:sodium-dependent transporter [archaeon]
MADGNEREGLNSRLGFLLLSAGCAIGLGNVWKFPYIVGQNGGGFFVLLYVFFLVVLGIPVLTMEFSIGRASRRSPLMMFRPLDPEGSLWHLRGWLCMAGCFLLMSFYAVVAGWMLYYLGMELTGGLSVSGVSQLWDVFDGMVADWRLLLGLTAVVVFGGFLICSFGLEKGLERVMKPMMLLMLLILVCLSVYCLTLDGASSGIDFYLGVHPDVVNDIGAWNICVAAMGQAFFTLSVGIGSMAIFGSYVDKRHTLLGEASRVALIDTLIAIMAGLLIFPACFTYGVDVGSGPPLIFITLPSVFNQMPGGQVFGAFFFLFMCLAAFSTCLTLFEAQISCVRERLGCSRRKVCAMVAPLMFLLTIPCILGYSILNGFQPLGPGTSVQDLEDFVVSYLLLPGGALVFAVFCTSRYGWGWKRFRQEANTGKGPRIQPWMRIYLTYLLPLIIAVLLVTGLVGRLT